MKERHFRIEQNPIDTRVIHVPRANHDTGKATALTKGIHPDAGDAVRDRDARQVGAETEGTIPDAGDAVRDRDTRQVGAIIEGIRLDAGDTVRDRDARQAGAPLEGIIPDAGDWFAFYGRRNHQLARRFLITASDGDLIIFNLIL